MGKEISSVQPGQDQGTEKNRSQFKKLGANLFLLSLPRVDADTNGCLNRTHEGRRVPFQRISHVHFPLIFNIKILMVSRKKSTNNLLTFDVTLVPKRYIRYNSGP